MRTEVARENNTVFYREVEGSAQSHVNPVLDVDWLELAKQKLTLLKIREKSFGNDADLLDGLVSLLDAIQDAREEQGCAVVWFTPADKAEG